MWSERRFLAAAIVLHFSIPVAAAVAPRPAHTGWLTAKASTPSEIDVDIDTAMLPEMDQDAPVGMPQPAIGPRMDPQTPRRMPVPVLTGDPPPDAPPGDPDNTFIQPPADAPFNPDGPGGEYYQPPAAGDVNTPGYGNPANNYGYGVPLPDDTGSGDPAPTTAPKRQYDPEQATKAIQQGITEKDRKLGLDFPGRGPVKKAFEGALYASDAPYDCQGSFTVKVNAKGKITDVSLNGFSGGSAETWQQVRRSAKATLASATLPMKSAFAKGAILGVVVRSQVKAAGGGTARDGLQLSFDVADAVAHEVRVVSSSVAVKPVE
jgi:hypothetical protein